MSLTISEEKFLYSFLTKHNIKVRKGFQNFAQNRNYKNAIVIDVDDQETLSLILINIYILNLKKEEAQRILVRPAAGRNQSNAESYSFTPVVDADIIIQLVGKSFQQIKNTLEPNVVEIGASVQIGEADRKLYDQFGLSLPTSSLIQNVTIAGLSANAGHGTGRDQPSFSGLIKAMTLCLPNGEIVRIDESHPDFNTIRGAHMGLFGIVLSVELQCVPAKKMHCMMDVCSVPDFLDKIKAGLYDNYPYVSVMYVPTYQADELTAKDRNNVIIYKWEPVDINVPNRQGCQVISHLIQSMQIKMEEGLSITDLMRHYPQLIPYFTRYLVSTVAIGNKNKESISPWYNMHYQSAFPRDIDDADYLFRVNSNYEEIETAFTKIVTTLNEYQKNGLYPVLDGVYLRLFKGTNGGLSTSAHNDDQRVCGIDIVSSQGILGYDQFKTEMADYFMKGPLKAKPHWGKFVPHDINYRDLYGDEFNHFIDVLNRWYFDHELELNHNMLLNAFHNQILNLPYKPEELLLKSPFVKKDSKVNITETVNALSQLIDIEHSAGKQLADQLWGIKNQQINKTKQDSFFCKALHPKSTQKEPLQQEQKSSCTLL